jgi:hypothetical protein
MSTGRREQEDRLIAARFAALMVASMGLCGTDEPEPRVVTPGPAGGMTAPPSDATVLFDGTSLDGWTTTDGKPAAWDFDKKAGGTMTAAIGKGSIISKQTFADAQIHVEFMTPVETGGEGQDRGNSGVYLQGRYEIQVLDSFKNSTYPNGQCAAVYGQTPPLVNACRPQGEWQTYDIVLHAAKVDAKGTKSAPARVTVIQNGVLVQDNTEITGPTGGAIGQGEAGPGPLLLQEHGHAVKFRNVWIRDLAH